MPIPPGSEDGPRPPRAEPRTGSVGAPGSSHPDEHPTTSRRMEASASRDSDPSSIRPTDRSGSQGRAMLNHERDHEPGEADSPAPVASAILWPRGGGPFGVDRGDSTRRAG